MMKDQGAGGGIESHMPTHRRQDSKEEPIPAEATAETQSPTPEPDQKEKLSQQELPRGSQILVGDETGAVTPAVEVAPSLSRNPSSCSTSSNVQPVSEYLAAQSTDRRPSAVQAAQSLSRNTSGSNVRPVSEYHAAQPTERRPLPLSRSTASSFPASSRPLEPPVTRTTLSELDVHKIIHNPKLRHDINFDPELHFRPNLDGERGRRKQEKANQFWAALLEQLVQFVVDRDGFIKAHGANGDWTLPSLLRAINEIISTLVPQRDRQVLEVGLNLDLLMQQFNRGVADLEKLASWLSGILKLHCAPMRDEWVDEMYAELSNGNRNNDMNELVKGMRSLLSVLEAMKLDVANHQIRCLRPVLIDDTVNFEQRFFLKKIQAKKLDVKKATAWYQEAQAQAHMLLGNSTPMLYAQSFGDTAVFFNALSRLILPSTSTENFPATFVFDEDRIIKLRADMYDSICLEICMRKFDDLDQVSRVAPMNTFLSAFSSGSARSSRSSGDFNFAAPRSRPSSMAFSDRGSVASSPRNSGGLFGHSIPDAGELRARSQTVYNSLLALLNTASPSSRSQQKWKSLAQPMALQILRYINNAPPLPEFEALLTKCLTEVQSDIFREVEAQFQQRLLAELAKRVKEFRSLSGVGLFSVATGGRIHGAGRTWDRSGDRDHRDSMIIDSGNGSSSREPRDEAGIDDMAVRLAHLGILHWRVWSQLAYEVDTEITGTD